MILQNVRLTTFGKNILSIIYPLGFFEIRSLDLNVLQKQSFIKNSEKRRIFGEIRVIQFCSSSTKDQILELIFLKHHHILYPSR